MCCLHSFLCCQDGDEIQVTLTEDQRLSLEDGAFVVLSEIHGATELNDQPPLPIKVLGPYSFSVTSNVEFSPYVKGGRVKESRQPRSVSFVRGYLCRLSRARTPQKRVFVDCYIGNAATHFLFVTSIRNRSPRLLTSQRLNCMTLPS